MIVIVDASAAVKLVLDEAHSDKMQRLWNETSLVLTSPTVVVSEVAAAVASANRAARISRPEHRAAIALWHELVGEIDLRHVDEGLAHAASDLAASIDRPVRGMDALYLATALEARSPDEEVGLASFDARQRAAIPPDAGIALLPVTIASSRA